MKIRNNLNCKKFGLNDTGQLSIDFLIGFTIFMTAFVMVITMTSGLLVGLQNRHIDYDAVAYRAGVLLCEDPGVNNTWPGFLMTDASEEWEFIGKSAKIDVKRFGLSLYKSTPRVLSEKKILSFSDRSIYDDLRDYHERIIFGNYPYNIYITLTPLDQGVNAFSIGNPPDQNTTYGYIRRIVTVKTPGEFSIDLDNYLNLTGGGNGKIIVQLNSSRLYDVQRGPVYWTDLMKERIRLKFNIKDINIVAKFPPSGINLTEVAYGYYKPDPDNPGSEIFVGPIPIVIPARTEGFTLIGDDVQTGHALHDVKNKIINEYDAGYFINKIPGDLTVAKIDLIYSFDPSTTYIHSEHPILFQNVPPVLVPAVLEVMVW